LHHVCTGPRREAEAAQRRPARFCAAGLAADAGMTSAEEMAAAGSKASGFTPAGFTAGAGMTATGLGCAADAMDEALRPATGATADATEPSEIYDVGVCVSMRIRWLSSLRQYGALACRSAPINSTRSRPVGQLIYPLPLT